MRALRSDRRFRLSRFTAAVGALAVLLLPSTGAAVLVPTGFADSLVTAATRPTGLAFTPDGRLLVAGQLGTVHVYEAGALLPTPALDLGPLICTDRERGLLGVAVDPAFASNRYIYVYYTFNKSATCAYAPDPAPVNRVARFVLSDVNVVDPTSERILIDNIPSPGGYHNGGDLHFGKDGYLYVSVGDGGCDYALDSGCGNQNDAARDLNALLGKVLRVTSDGAAPADNPFQGEGTVPCASTGVAPAGTKCQETFAWGLRNPFRIAFDPNAAATRFYINDVGQNHWEEIDEATAGADYGWNVREGHCATGSTTNCGPPPAGMTNPIFDYAHFSGLGLPTDGCESITGGAFVPSGAWSSEYDGAYLFGDFVCGKIFRLTPGATGGFTATEFVTGLGQNSVTTMLFGPDGALYYTLNFYSGGEIRKLDFLGAANRPPTASLTASPTSGPVPLTVSFDGSASSDPDGDPLTYLWDFGDGATVQIPAATVSHTYMRGGTYTASLTVRDDDGALSAPATIRIDAGNAAPVATIVAPTADKLFRVGEEITLTGTATDPEDGTLADSALTWTVVLHHDTHIHPFFGPASGNGLVITAPAPEGLAAAANSYLEIQLTVTDSEGLTTTVTQALRPNLVDLTVATEPAGLTVEVNGTPVVAPHTVTSWEGYEIDVNAPDQSQACADSWLFERWSDGGAAAHSIATPASDTTYTATFKSGWLFRDGFETGDLSQWTSAFGLVVEPEAVVGSYAARALSFGTPAYAYERLESPATELYYRFRFKIESQGDNSLDLLRLRTATGAGILSVFVSERGNLKIRNLVTAETISSTRTVSIVEWHELQLHVRIDGTSSETEVWLDDASIDALATTTTLGTTAIGRIQMGDKNVGRLFDVRFDDVAASKTFIAC